MSADQLPNGGKRVSKFAVLVVVAALLVPRAYGDPTSVPGDAAEGVFSESSSSRGQPDGATGSMSWNYQFILPVARGLPQPKLNLTYSSSSRDREAGYGWGLDLPTIERRPLSGNPCFLDDGTPIVCWKQHVAGPPIVEERYTFNGQPLVFICHTSGAAGACAPDAGKEPLPAWTKTGGWRYYRLQSEGQFLRFFLSGNRRYWRVQMKGGERLEFGEPPGSSTPGVEHILGNKKAIIRWRLVRHYDSLHQVAGVPLNAVDYRWAPLGKRGLLYLTDIFDTPRANGLRTDLDFAHHTQLTWQAPPFPQTFYADAYRAAPDLRLTRVAVSSMPWSGTGPRETLRTYSLLYAPMQGAQPANSLSPAFLPWNHSFLAEVQVQGRCRQFEDERGNIPSDRECQAGHLPSTTFEYEDGYPVFGAASITKVDGGPPGAVDQSRVLPYMSSVGLVDFNRDGLPDIVQGWSNHLSCGLTTLPNSDENVLRCQNARPMIGYLNRGIDPATVKLAYQCFDAGTIDDTRGLSHYAFGAVPPRGFFTNSDSVTLVDSWSEGVLAWSNAQYAPYRARPLLPGPGDYFPGDGCDADQFNLNDFIPGWKWEKSQVNIDWAKLSTDDPDGAQARPAGGSAPKDGGFPARATRYFADVDGDGLTDRLVGDGKQAFEFESAFVEYTNQYAQGTPLPVGGKGPAQIPFTTSFDQPTSLAPGPSKWMRKETRVYYVDINGDGLVDLVTYNPDDGGGVPRVRPGDGRGHFGCETSQQPWPCKEFPREPAPVYEITATGSRLPWPFNDETFFHDVTADGLADIVQYDVASGEVRLWVNIDGHNFACITASCVAGKVVDNRTGTFAIGEHRTTFADMNADGVDDMVILTKQGAYVGMFMKKYAPVAGFQRGAPRPGLLIRVQNGYGASTDIRYRSIQDLDLAVRNTDDAWAFHSPVAESVVTEVVTQDSYHAGGDLSDPRIDAPYQFKRRTRYAYKDPAYDRWTRRFVGFRKVAARYGDENATTSTTYWFGPCQNNGLDARLPQSPDIPLCPKGSDDEDDKSLVGRAVRVDRGNELLSAFPLDLGTVARFQPPPAGPSLLWSKTFQYARATLFTRPDRRVTFSYPTQVDTYLYDEDLPVTRGSVFDVLAGTAEAAVPHIGGGDVLEAPPHQKGTRKHLRSSTEYDSSGNLRSVTKSGSIKDVDTKAGAAVDATTITVYSPRDTQHPNGPDNPTDMPARLPCTSDWRCVADYVSVWELPPNQSPKLLRKTRFTYNAVNDLQLIERWLETPVELLQRKHPSGVGSVAPMPAGQTVAKGWHTFAKLSYDDFGNVSQSVGGHSPGASPAACTITQYDDAYRQLPQRMHRFKDGCTGAELETRTIYDRGFGSVVSSTAPSGATSEIRLDPYGRPMQVLLPDPDAAIGTQKPILVATIEYTDRKPLSYVSVIRNVAASATIRTVSILNGLGESVVSFDQGPNNDWVLSGWRETNSRGQPLRLRRPWQFTGDPVAAALKTNTFPVPTDNSALEIRYDAYGRRNSVWEAVASASQEMVRTSFFPLGLEIRDAEQLKVGGPHSKAFRRVEFDGYGRITRTLDHIENPRVEDIVTAVRFNAVGEPVTVSRTAGGQSYLRSMKFDSFGRVMINNEPNTGGNWRYAWDDADRLIGTSDARGCGVNFHYDGLGRLLGEDYSPCLKSQPIYTRANLATGKGLETLYRYDIYEADQLNPEPAFVDDAQAASGNLVAVLDRGSHTRFNYDARGRVRRVSRQLAKPETSASGSRYAPHWFVSRTDYDPGDRLTRRTTGADVPELLMNGQSEERYAYSASGQLSAIDSSYGAIIKSAVYAPSGAPQGIVYGDARATTASFAYDTRGRLTKYLLVAPYNGILSPDEHFNFRYSAYDDLGNPLTIEDVRAPWTPLPPEAAPLKKRTMQYDDLYRLVRINNTYATPPGTAPWQSPFDSEITAGNRRPVPMRTLATRVGEQTFAYDGLGNLTASGDDLGARYDRSLGAGLVYGSPQNGPDQLQSGQGLQVRYDKAGNMSELRVQRPGTCPLAGGSSCAQWFAYDWNEVGELSRARRWDFAGNALPPRGTAGDLPVVKPAVDMLYAYSQGTRVRKTLTEPDGSSRHTLEVFDTLRIEHAPFNATTGDYRSQRDTMQVFPGGLGHVFWDSDGRLPHLAADSLLTMHLVMTDRLGSSSVVINHSTSELVERTTYDPYGAIESDYRPARWNAFREPYKFTGKEEDVEVGLTYFGARYYQPHLGRFMSPDPMTIHAGESDLNPYAYVAGRVFAAIDPQGLAPAPPGAEVYPDGTWSIESASGSGTDYEVGNINEGATPKETLINETGAPAGASTTREIIDRGEPAAGTSRDRPSVGATVRAAAISGLKAGALSIVDPIGVNRAFVDDVTTAADTKASTTLRGIAVAGAVLSVIPMLGEARGVLGGAKMAGGGGARGARGLSKLLTGIVEAWRSWNATARRQAVTEALYEMSHGEAYLEEIPRLARTPQGVATLELMLDIIAKSNPVSAADRAYQTKLGNLILKTLRP